MTKSIISAYQLLRWMKSLWPTATVEIYQDIAPERICLWWQEGEKIHRERFPVGLSTDDEKVYEAIAKNVRKARKT